MAIQDAEVRPSDLARLVPSGVYLLRLEAGGAATARKVVLAR